MRIAERRGERREEKKSGRRRKWRVGQRLNQRLYLAFLPLPVIISAWPFYSGVSSCGARSALSLAFPLAKAVHTTRPSLSLSLSLFLCVKLQRPGPLYSGLDAPRPSIFLSLSLDSLALHHPPPNAPFISLSCVSSFFFCLPLNSISAERKSAHLPRAGCRRHCLWRRKERRKEETSKAARKIDLLVS